jgi:D-alanyl-D-alanine carboxypeptidase (penicillin-binding protein 5/6)
MSYGEPARRRFPRSIIVMALVVLATALAGALGYQSLATSARSLAPRPLPARSVAPSSSTTALPLGVIPTEAPGPGDVALPSSVWPAHGQAAVQIGASEVQASPNQRVVPIASVAKVMTAYLVLRDHPLVTGQEGPTITLTEADVADTERRRRQHESVVPMVVGERLTELQALQALLLPSANNVAAVLARWNAGSVAGFVAEMNATGRRLGMTDTRYTDPSGFDEATVSTAADQVLIVDEAMRLPVFAAVVATQSVNLPVAGTVHNTDTLLGNNGFVGVKTGWSGAARGCFAFRAIRSIDGVRTTITGVVLGQPGPDELGSQSGLEAAAALVDRIAAPAPERSVAPGMAP